MRLAAIPRAFASPVLATRAQATHVRSVGLRALDATDLAGQQTRALPASIVEVESLPAPVWIPAATTITQRSPFQLYLTKLRRYDAFQGAQQALAELQTKAEKPAKLSSDKPRVAILVNHPKLLIPGVSETIPRLVEIVRKNGAEPILIPPVADILLPENRENAREQLKEYLKNFDALIGPGGGDIHPRIYGEQNTHSIKTNYVRDRFEADVFLVAAESELFTLAICRSHQLINAALGGKLAQDVIEDGYSSITRNQAELGIPKDQPLVTDSFQHCVRPEPNSDFQNLLRDPGCVLTNSFHHQTVIEPGKGLTVTGTLTDPITGKTTIEASEGKTILTTQFHPELMPDDPKMQDLVGTAARRAHVFQLKKGLQKEGKLSLENLLDAMRTKKGNFHPADFSWVESKLLT